MLIKHKLKHNLMNSGEYSFLKAKEYTEEEKVAVSIDYEAGLEVITEWLMSFYGFEYNIIGTYSELLDGLKGLIDRPSNWSKFFIYKTQQNDEQAWNILQINKNQDSFSVLYKFRLEEELQKGLQRIFKVGKEQFKSANLFNHTKHQDAGIEVICSLIQIMQPIKKVPYFDELTEEKLKNENNLKISLYAILKNYLTTFIKRLSEEKEFLEFKFEFKKFIDSIPKGSKELDDYTELLTKTFSKNSKLDNYDDLDENDPIFKELETKRKEVLQRYKSFTESYKDNWGFVLDKEEDLTTESQYVPNINKKFPQQMKKLEIFFKIHNFICDFIPRYDLCLMQDLTAVNAPVKNEVYLEQVGDELKYKVVANNGQTIEDKLNIDLSKSNSYANFNEFLHSIESNILSELSTRGHILSDYYFWSSISTAISKTLQIDNDTIKFFLVKSKNNAKIEENKKETQEDDAISDLPSTVSYDSHEDDEEILSFDEILEKIEVNKEKKLWLKEQDEKIQEYFQSKNLTIQGADDSSKVSKPIKDWDPKEIKEWSKAHKSKLSATEKGKICEAIAVMDRANQLVTGGHRLRDTQKIAILMFLNANEDKGHISQIKTGEGKTTIISFIAALKVFQGKQVDVITSNGVLAAEGVKDKNIFYKLLGITVSHNNPEDGYVEGARECYSSDIVYGSINNFQFDYLRDSFERMETFGERKIQNNWVILDEIDSLLIDQGGNIAKISGPFPGMESFRYMYINIWAALIEVEEEVIRETIEKLRNKSEQLNKKINVGLSKEDQNRIENDNQTEYEREEHRLKENFFEEIKHKIKDKKEDIKKEVLKLMAKHLYLYVEKHFEDWVGYAIAAKYQYQEDHHYKVIKKGEEYLIIPVDNANTGVSLKNTILSNGLHQFLQLKHNLGLTYESLTSSFVSNLGYINKYGNKILGLTGTLGSEAERELLALSYNVDFSAIPTYKRKRFKEFPLKASKDIQFINDVAISALGELTRKNSASNEVPRAVLIICESIKDANDIKKEINKEIEATGIAANIIPYMDEKDADEAPKTLKPRDIVIATNIAGRGTDFKTSEDLEENGGLHVIVSFVPCNQRVEEQALGRTARQGNYGTGQIITRLRNARLFSISNNISDLKEQRNASEKSRLEEIKQNKLKELQFMDRLFQKFSALYGKLKVEHKKDEDAIRWVYVLKDLKEKWAFWLDEQNYTKNFTELNKKWQLENKNSKQAYIDLETKEFSKFEQDKVVQNIINGEIHHNPFYSICLAERYLENANKYDLNPASCMRKFMSEGYQKAEQELQNAIKINQESGSEGSEFLYTAYIKLFEARIDGTYQLLKRFAKAVSKVFVIGHFKECVDDKTYKKEALEFLRKAKCALRIEYEYLKLLFDSCKLDQIINARAPTKTDANLLCKHIQSRFTCLQVYLGNIGSLAVHLGGSTELLLDIKHSLNSMIQPSEGKFLLKDSLIDELIFTTAKEKEIIEKKEEIRKLAKKLLTSEEDKALKQKIEEVFKIKSSKQIVETIKVKIKNITDYNKKELINLIDPLIRYADQENKIIENKRQLILLLKLLEESINNNQENLMEIQQSIEEILGIDNIDFVVQNIKGTIKYQKQLNALLEEILQLRLCFGKANQTPRKTEKIKQFVERLTEELIVLIGDFIKENKIIEDNSTQLSASLEERINQQSLIEKISDINNIDCLIKNIKSKIQDEEQLNILDILLKQMLQLSLHLEKTNRKSQNAFKIKQFAEKLGRETDDNLQLKKEIDALIGQIPEKYDFVVVEKLPDDKKIEHSKVYFYRQQNSVGLDYTVVSCSGTKFQGNLRWVEDLKICNTKDLISSIPISIFESCIVAPYKIVPGNFVEIMVPFEQAKKSLTITGISKILENKKEDILSITNSRGHTQTEVNQIKEGAAVGTKVPRYLDKLSPKVEHEKKIKETITVQEIDELEYIGINSVYQLKEVHNVSDNIIYSAQAQIGGGLALLATSYAFPPSLAVTGSIAGTLISEGITDIVTELISRGEATFNAKEYIKGKMISYGISIITMGISAILSSTEILQKAVDACRNLAEKLRNVGGRFASVCNWAANKLDKIADYIAFAIDKIEMAKKSMDAQKEMLAGLRDKAFELTKAGDFDQSRKLLSQYQQLQKLQKATDLVLSPGKQILGILTTSAINPLKSIAVSVCTEKLVTANVNRMMASTELKSYICKEVTKKVKDRIDSSKSILNEIEQEYLERRCKELFETSLGEDAAHIFKEISMGVLRHCNNWKVQLSILAFDTMISAKDIYTLTNKMCDKFFKDIEKLKTSTIDVKQNDYGKIINILSNQITEIIYNKLVSITGKILTTIPKALYNRYKENQERQKDAEAVDKMEDRIVDIVDADEKAKKANMACAQEAISSMVEANTEQLADATNLAASENGTTKEDMEQMMVRCGITGIEGIGIQDADNVRQFLENKNSDRGIACLTDKEGNNHAVACVLDNGEVKVYENGIKVPLEQYLKEHNYQNGNILVGENCNAENLGQIRKQMNYNRVALATHAIDYVGQGDGDKYGQHKPRGKRAQASSEVKKDIKKDPRPRFLPHANALKVKGTDLCHETSYNDIQTEVNRLWGDIEGLKNYANEFFYTPIDGATVPPDIEKQRNDCLKAIDSNDRQKTISILNSATPNLRPGSSEINRSIGSQPDPKVNSFGEAHHQSVDVASVVFHRKPDGGKSPFIKTEDGGVFTRSSNSASPDGFVPVNTGDCAPRNNINAMHRQKFGIS